MNVLILNLNLAVDKTVLAGRLERGRIYRFSETLTAPGGKGVNVARALLAWGLRPKVTGFISGLNGLWIERALKAEGLGAFLVRHKSGESRVCLSVVDSRGLSTDFNEEGPAVPARAQADFLRRLAAMAGGFKVLAVCGRVSAGLKKGFYAKIVRMGKARGCFTVFDASGWVLKEGLAAGADAVKINRYEFEELSGRGFSARGLSAFFKKYEKNGLKALIVTDRANPSFAVSPFGLWRIAPPKLAGLKSPVGAGDSFLAGFLAGFMNGFYFERTLKLAAGFAASDCLSLGSGVIDRREALAFAQKAAVKKIL
ncbi:MAG: PfkB family carbohydrate kinase [Elusimicrobia bacterium]|nr:PfkB family carbohydrate kinase [Elusimicrobiota bacterium]